MDLLAQLRAGQVTAQTLSPLNLSQYEKVVFVGLGGSIMASEAISMLWPGVTTSESCKPVAVSLAEVVTPGWLDQSAQYIVRGLHLPHWINQKHLIIASSWSGETAETIGLVKQAIAQKIATIVITSNQESPLATLAKTANLPTIMLPRLVEIPRLAMPLMLGAQLTVLGQSVILNEADKFAQALQDKATQEAQTLTQVIGDKLTLIYSSCAWRYLGSFWKTFINETAERHCFYNFIPGALHNEIAAIKSEGNQFCYIVLSDRNEDELEINQLTRLASWFEKLQLTVLRLEITGQSRLEKILYQYLLAANTSALLPGGKHNIPIAIKDFKKK